MNERTQIYDWFARMLNYPQREQLQDSSKFRVEVLSIADSRFMILDSQITNHLELFKQSIEHLSLQEMEELYTRTFDINPVASLEIGWHLFGETYDRGAFLVKMREMLRQHNIEESSELPDHLTHCLLVFGRMSKNESAEFARQYLLPSLDKIIDGFQGKENPYEHLLLALKNLIEQEHQLDKPNFQKGVETHV